MKDQNIMINHARWCFNASRWTPARDEWLKLTSSIAQDELERVNKYVYQENAKDALIGRALIRKFLADATYNPSSEPTLIRTEHGRPQVCEEYKRTKGNNWPKLLDFNVSHSGDYCILGGLWSDGAQPLDIRIGVDVTKIVRKNTKPELDRFLELMSRKPFTKAEWSTVDNATSDRQKCINFTRLWCLKESYIKSTGLGLTFKLDRIDFRFPEKHRLSLSIDELKGRILNDTAVALDGRLATDWQFHETALDDEHIVALGYNVIDLTYEAIDLTGEPFQEVEISSLIRSLTPIRASNELDWLHFSSRQRRTN